MSYGIIRVRKLHIGDLKGTQKHNLREFASGELPENINPLKSFFSTGSKDYEYEVTEKLKGVPIRKDSVVAIEYVCAISKEAMDNIIRNDYSEQTVLAFCAEFVRKKHGDENIIGCTYHLDETNPHVHILAVPLVEKSVKWKNQKGQGEKIENRLCARDFIGGKDKLRELQTDYFNHLTTGNQYFSDKWKQYGIEFFRGRDARTSKQYYSKMTSHIVGNALQELRDARELRKQQKISEEQLNVIEDAMELKISAISDNMEKKMTKDQEQRTNLHKWNQNTPDFGM